MARFTAADEATVMQALVSKAEGKKVKATEVGGQRREFEAMAAADMMVLLREIREDIAAGAAEISGPLRAYAKNGGVASC